MTESSAHGVILWIVLRWRRPLSAMRLCHCGLLSGVDQKSCCVWQGHFGGFLLCIAQVSMRKLPSLAVMPSAFLFAFILPGPACCLLIQHCLLPKERWSSPKSDSLLEWQHDAPHPFYLLCLSCVCTEPASSLDPQGRVCSSSSPRLVQE